MFTRDDFERACETVYAAMQPTLANPWPLLREALGVETWVKHENHTPTGAFKVRGGLNYLVRLLEDGPRPAGLISATRGNHGQSIPFAAALHGLPVTIVVPRGNSPEKNAAMRALGAELVEHGDVFDEAREHATALARERGLHMVPPFHEWLVAGVATYAKELFDAAGPLDAIYAPIGMGSGVCGLIAMRDMLGLKTDIIGVVAEGAPAYLHSWERGRPVTTPVATFADGMAVGVPHPQAVEIINEGAARIVAVSDEEIAEAMRLLHTATHNVAEGAGAAALAALMKERETMRGRRCAVILSGGNIDAEKYAAVLGGETPAP